MRPIVRAGRSLALGLALCLASPSPTPAQEDVEAVPTEGQGEGKPLFGYLACGAGCIAIMFILCISARR